MLAETTWVDVWFAIVLAVGMVSGVVCLVVGLNVLQRRERRR